MLARSNPTVQIIPIREGKQQHQHHRRRLPGKTHDASMVEEIGGTSCSGPNDLDPGDPSKESSLLVKRVAQLEAENVRLRDELSRWGAAFGQEAAAHVARVGERRVRDSASLNGTIPEPLPADDAEKYSAQALGCSPTTMAEPPTLLPFHSPLTPDEVSRYSRPILAGLGTAGQLQLLKASVLVIGAGGIGSSCVLYLAGAGIGRLGIVDGDVVEVTNLHRQVIHSSERVGLNKAVSAQQAVLRLNPTISCAAYETTLTHDNVMGLFASYHVIVDATDNPHTRYLINDSCVLAGKPLVFASAVGTEGQVSVFHFRQSSCYRCLYPHPSASASCASCADAGVLGPVPGVVGVLQATEVIKILLAGVPSHPWNAVSPVLSDHLLQYDALAVRFWRVKKPPRNSACPVCSPENATIRSLDDSRRNLQHARGPSRAPATTIAAVGSCAAAGANSCSEKCGVPTAGLPPTSLEPLSRAPSSYKEVSVCEYAQVYRLNSHPHVLLDVRVPLQYELCHLSRAVSIPLVDLSSRLDDVLQLASLASSDSSSSLPKTSNDNPTTPRTPKTAEYQPVYCLCRRGVASAAAAELLHRELCLSRQLSIVIYSIAGGLTAWHEQVDPSFPIY